PQKWLGAQRPTGDPLAQFAGAEAPAVLVDVTGEPIPKRFEIAGAELLVEGADLLLGGLEELSGVEVPQRVGREVAHQAKGPVNVLQAPLRVVGNRNAQVIGEALVPDAWNVVDVQVATDQSPLQFEAQHDV